MNKKSFDNILSELVKVLGPYSENIVLGGGIALLVYRYYFSEDLLLINPAVTKDLDLLIPRNLKIQPSLAKRLEEFGFKRTTHSLEIPPVESYSTMFDGEEIILEFLTDRRSRDSKDKNVLVGGISAQPLSFIEMSLENPLSFNVGDKIKTQVVSPERWLFHKALTFPKRRSQSKMCKDLYGIWYVGSQLGQFSNEARQRFLLLANDKPSTWKNNVKKQILGWIASASPADWKKLEAQDPAQKISKLSFIDFIESKLLLNL